MITAATFALFAAILVSGSAYLLTLALAGTLPARRVKPRTKASPSPRFAVLVPAHNEALSLGATLDSILAAADAPGRDDVFVIADNCTDATAAVARGRGVQVWERHAPEQRGKGQALDAFLKGFRLLLARYDLVAFFDADTLVDRGFFRAMTAAFGQQPPLTAAQGFYGVSNPRENWRTQLSHLALLVAHDLRQAARTRLGGNAGLKGNGMVFRQAFLAAQGWPAHSVVEDLELGLRLTVSGQKIGYVPAAIVRGVLATSREAVNRQRRRWEGGRGLIARQWLPRLWLAAGPRFSGRSFEAALDLAFPPLGSWLVCCGLGLAAGIWRPELALFGLVGVGSAGLLVAAALWRAREPWQSWLTLARVPLFLAQKYAFTVTSRWHAQPLTWERTARNAEARAR